MESWNNRKFLSFYYFQIDEKKAGSCQEVVHEIIKIHWKKLFNYLLLLLNYDSEKPRFYRKLLERQVFEHVKT